MDRLPLSVAIITYNEEDVIGRTLEAVKDIASEIVVVDSHSTDRTREIAKSYGAKVYVEEWKGYAGQKNSALKKCTQEWILFLDADEVVSEELKESIRRELRNPKADGYMINRRTYYMGRLLKYTWQPEWRLFLVRRNVNPRWIGEPHAKLTIESTNVSKIRGDLLHYPYGSFWEHMQKTYKYARIGALEYRKSGKKPRVYNVVFNPLWAFLKTYVVRGGIFDGVPGLIASCMTMIYTFFKYALLYDLELKDKYGNRLWGRKGYDGYN